MKLHPTKLRILVLALAAWAVILAGLSLPAQAAPALQMTPFPTPTPGADGRIIYIVQPGDTLLRISLISGVSIDEIRALNNIVGDNIIEGQQLLLGLGGPSEATPQPGSVTATPTSILPTPTTRPGLGNICILLFEDMNGDSIRQEEEPAIPGGALNVSNRSGSISETGASAPGTEPVCFEQLGEGNFTITVAVPEGYNPTTVTTYSLTLNAGDEIYLDFGAQKNTQTLAELPVASGGSSPRNPLLGIIGGVLLLGGVVLALFARRLLKSGGLGG